MNTIKSKVRNFIHEEFLRGDSSQDIQDDTHLLESGIMDSISTLRLVAFLEQEFGFRFEAHEAKAENLSDLNRIERFVSSKISAPDKGES